MGILYVTATPIGNLKDITFRAVEILKQADLVLAEDTRVAKKLLSCYKIKTRIISYHQHSKLNKINNILDLLKEGRKLALISDSGTPGISDPGNKLIKEIISSLKNVKIEPIPGPSAVAAALSCSGVFSDKFLFLGFPPSKNKRKKFFEKIAKSEYTVVFYESCHRIIRTLEDLKNAGVLNIIVCRELTKKFETIYRGKISDIIRKIKQGQDKGEFVVIIEKNLPKN